MIRKIKGLFYFIFFKTYTYKVLNMIVLFCLHKSYYYGSLLYHFYLLLLLTYCLILFCRHVHIFFRYIEKKLENWAEREIINIKFLTIDFTSFFLLLPGLGLYVNIIFLILLLFFSYTTSYYFPHRFLSLFLWH